MKKHLGILLIALLILGAGSAVFAAETDNDPFTFEDMLPFMQKMHPNLSKQQLEQMYNACHGPNGMMQYFDSQLQKDSTNKGL